HIRHHFLQLAGEGIGLHEGADQGGDGGGVVVGERGEAGDLLRHVQAPVGRQALEQDVGELSGRCPAPGRHVEHQAVSPTTLMTEATWRTVSISANRCWALACAASGAAWVMRSKVASSPRPSCHTERIDTPASPNAPAIAASTPGASSTS